MTGFKQITISDRYMYGLDQDGAVWVCMIASNGQQMTEWRRFVIGG